MPLRLTPKWWAEYDWYNRERYLRNRLIDLASVFCERWFPGPPGWWWRKVGSLSYRIKLPQWYLNGLFWLDRRKNKS